MGLGESPTYSLEVEQDEVCFKAKEATKVGRAKKGLGPSRGKAVGVLPALTPVARPQPEPMEVEEDLAWLLEASQEEPAVPREEEGVVLVAPQEEVVKREVPVEVVKRKVPVEVVKRKAAVPQQRVPEARKTPAPLGKSLGTRWGQV